MSCHVMSCHSQPIRLSSTFRILTRDYMSFSVYKPKKPVEAAFRKKLCTCLYALVEETGFQNETIKIILILIRTFLINIWHYAFDIRIFSFCKFSYNSSSFRITLDFLFCFGGWGQFGVLSFLFVWDFFCLVWGLFFLFLVFL